MFVVSIFETPLVLFSIFQWACVQLLRLAYFQFSLQYLLGRLIFRWDFFGIIRWREDGFLCCLDLAVSVRFATILCVTIWGIVVFSWDCVALWTWAGCRPGLVFFPQCWRAGWGIRSDWFVFWLRKVCCLLISFRVLQVNLLILTLLQVLIIYHIFFVW